MKFENDLNNDRLHFLFMYYCILDLIGTDTKYGSVIESKPRKFNNHAFLCTKLKFKPYRSLPFLFIWVDYYYFLIFLILGCKILIRFIFRIVFLNIDDAFRRTLNI